MANLKSWMYNRNRIQFKQKNPKIKGHNPSDRIAFLVDGRQSEKLKVIEKYIDHLQQIGKDITLLFLTDHTHPEQVSFQAFNQKSFTWYHIPKAPVVIDFIQKDFDLLISFNDEQIPEIKAIVDLSNAKFKIGIMEGHSNLFDLVINPLKAYDWSNYIKTLEKTLDQLSTERVMSY